MFTAARSSRAIAATIGVLTVGLVSGCSGGSSGSGNSAPTTPATGSTSSSSSAAAPSGNSLSKEDFLTAMNADCKTTNAKIKANAAPTGPTDYDGIQKYLAVVLAERDPFYQRADALVGQTEDKTELTTKWLTPAEKMAAEQDPLFSQLVAAAKAKDDAKLTALFAQLSALDDTSDQIASFLTSYGLTDCADLEGS
jgi:hypothetical protein